MKYQRGSVWRKWDLHVHTPDSLFQNYSGPDPWERFIQELEQLPPEFKVIGINDYIFLDGYKRILTEKEKGRLANIELFLPVIELRIDKFGGTAGHLSRVNYHIIFSSELSPIVIEQQFLNALSSRYVLSPEYDHLRTNDKWEALPTKESLEDLGRLIIESVPENKRKDFYAPLREGFNNFCVSLDTIQKALKSHYFKGKVVTAVGKTEWANIKWNDRSIADKKTIINAADLVFISSETIEDWKKAKKSLAEGGVNNRLLDCSDAHSFSDAKSKDRIGKCFTWIKADPTFEGLLQILNEPDDRTFVGDIPQKLVQVQNNKTKYIHCIRIERKPETTWEDEIWFNNTILFNPGLVAIIGNKGKGKSALSDTVGLLGNTMQYQDFTFLSQNNFRQPKDNKAKHFRAELSWESGATISRGLDESIHDQQPELVKYLPQNFLEKVCTQLGKIEESDFDQELKKVIFSHVDPADRLGMVTLDNLIAYKTSEANAKIQILKQGLHKKNKEIVILEEKSQPDYFTKIQNILTQKQQELESHDKSKPEKVSKPESDPEKQRHITKLADDIEAAKKQLAGYEDQITSTKEDQAKYAQLFSVADRLVARIENLEHQISLFESESRADLESMGLSIKDIFTFSFNKQPLTEKRKSFSEQKTKLENLLNPSKPNSFEKKKQNIEKQLEILQLKLDEPNRKYQAYIAALENWQKIRNEIVGNESSLGTVKYYEKQLKDLEAVPVLLNQARDSRLAIAKEIYAVIKQLAVTYRELYTPVHQFIKKQPLTKDKFQLNFEVGIVDTGFEDNFFEIVSHGVSGTFCGIEEGQKTLRTILKSHDFNIEAGIEAFLIDIMDSLEKNRPESNSVRVVDQLRKGKNALELYDLIFSLDYLKPRYTLRMGDKELHQLSPGERGALLLIFFLLLDKDDKPLVIDQPEENLDNQTVYELLVPCMKEAKKRRQIVMVTHNPNLAVVCDAEQVVWADLNKKDNYRMRYVTGSIENPILNKAIVDILEGTMPAFDNRESKYLNAIK